VAHFVERAPRTADCYGWASVAQHNASAVATARHARRRPGTRQHTGPRAALPLPAEGQAHRPRTAVPFPCGHASNILDGWVLANKRTHSAAQMFGMFFFPSKMSGRSELNVEEAENFNKGEIRTMSHRPHIWSNRWCAPPTAVSSPSLAYGLWRRLRRAAVTAACSPAHPQYQARQPPTHLQVAPPRADAGAASWQIKETWHG